MAVEQEPLSCVEIEPRQEARYSVIWLHGLGADGHDFEPLVPALGLPDSVPIRFVFPHAPMRPVTLNNGFVMRAWFDISTLDRIQAVDSDGIHQSTGAIQALIDREIERGVDAGRIILAGFSQGAVIAVQAALQYPRRLAGVIALSTYLPLADELKNRQSPANADIPVFMAHGLYDATLDIKLGRQAHLALKAFHEPVEWHEYPMDHAVCPDEIQDLSRWLQTQIID